MKSEVDLNNLPAQSGTPAPLHGARIGFFTSVGGVGRSEVLVLDAMEAAFAAGAEVMCWSPAVSGVRELAPARADRLEFDHRVLFGPAATPLQPIPSTTAGTPNERRNPISNLWRRAIPIPVKLWAGFHRAARRLQPSSAPINPTCW